jgi:hypothetical protein
MGSGECSSAPRYSGHEVCREARVHSRQVLLDPGGKECEDKSLQMRGVTDQGQRQIGLSLSEPGLSQPKRSNWADAS